MNWNTQNVFLTIIFHSSYYLCHTLLRESNNVIQFSRRCPPKCANHIHSQWDQTEFMNRFYGSPFADWLERNDMDCFFHRCAKQQCVRQWKPFDNHNKANSHKANNKNAFQKDAYRPPAVAVRGGGCLPGGVSSQGVGVCPEGCLPRGVSA